MGNCLGKPSSQRSASCAPVAATLSAFNGPLHMPTGGGSDGATCASVPTTANGGGLYPHELAAVTAKTYKPANGGLPPSTHIVAPTIVGAGAKSPPLFVALYDYEARTNEDLSFRRNDLLEVLNDTQGDWWLARNVSTGKQGWAPGNFLARNHSVDAQIWYFGKLRRVEAERLLLGAGNIHGSFLVRDSESRSNEYALSVRDGESVKHYRIRPLDDGNLFITRRATFHTLQALIAHYSRNADGLCVALGKPPLRDNPDTRGFTYDDQWEIDRRSLRLVCQIGAGQNRSTLVAVKKLKPGLDRNDFLAEAETMKQLRHPKLLQLYAVCTRQEPILIVTQLMDENLLHFLQGRGRNSSMCHLMDIATQIANGMAYLEEKAFIHRDLAARNILVSNPCSVKIADFGLARLIRENEYEARIGARFPIKWTAPESATRNLFTIKSDIWSFGILISEIVTFGKTPYPGMTNAEVLQRVENGYRMPCPPGCPIAVYSIMLECWNADPQKRPTFETLEWRLETVMLGNDSSEYKEAHMA